MTPTMTLFGLIAASGLNAVARPGLTLAASSVLLYVAVSVNHIALPDELLWLHSPSLVLFTVVLGMFDLFIRHDPDLAEWAEEMRISRAASALVSGALALIWTSIEADSSAFSDTSLQHAGHFREAYAALGEHHWSSGAQAIIALTAVTFTITISALRRKVIGWVLDLDLHEVVAWLETGGVLVTVVLLPLAPILVLLLLTMVSVSSFALSRWTERQARARDEAARVPCGSCGQKIRREAMICPHCRQRRIRS